MIKARWILTQVKTNNISTTTLLLVGREGFEPSLQYR